MLPSLDTEITYLWHLLHVFFPNGFDQLTASAVADYLLNSNAVTERRMNIVGTVDIKPIESDTMQEGRSQNR